MGLFDFLRRRNSARSGGGVTSEGSQFFDAAMLAQSLAGAAESDLTCEYLARRDVNDVRMAQSQLCRALSRLSNMSQVGIVHGLWERGHDLYPQMLEPAPPQLEGQALVDWMQRKIIAGHRAAERNPSNRLRTRTDLTPAHRRFESCLAEVKKLSRDNSGLLAEPLLPDGPVVSPVGSRTVVQWGYFNPNGPTLCDLCLEFVERKDACLLVFNSAHPFQPSASVYGLIEDSLAGDPRRLTDVLREVFAGADGGEHSPLTNLPTHLRVPPESPLINVGFAEVMALVAERYDQGDLTAVASAMERHWCDPWARVRAQQSDFLSALAAARGSGKDLESALTDAVQGGARRPYRREDFDRWYELATHTEHVEAELHAIPLAWAGSVLQVSGRFR